MLKRKNTTGIPDFEIESIASSLIPGLLKFYSSDEGKKEYEKYKQSQTDNKSQNQGVLMTNKIIINREPYKSNGKELFSYYITGVLNDRPNRINLVPIDVGGYAVLDILFADNSTVELIIVEENGKQIYKAVSCDDDGKVYECEVKPLHGSDRVKLKLILEKGGDA